MSYYGGISTPSNRADWINTCLVMDDDTGEPIDISLCRITMTILKVSRNPNYYRDGYYGRIYPNAIILKGSTDTGEITVPQLGVFQWIFSADRMNGLPQGQYEIGIRLSQDDQTMQLVIGSIDVMEGIDWAVINIAAPPAAAGGPSLDFSQPEDSQYIGTILL